MKQTVWLVLLSCVILFASCKKNTTDTPNTDDVRLIGMSTILPNGDIGHTGFNYDASGRLINVTGHGNNQTPVVIFTVSYNNNEAIMVVKPFSGGGAVTTDSTRYSFDANNRLVKKILYSYHEFMPPAGAPQRTYIYDTTTYEYDAAGLLKKETHGHWDSTWFKPNDVETYSNRTTGTTNHTITNGNARTVSSISNSSSVSRQFGNTFTSNDITETTATYEYSKAYANKTDFTNAAILSDLFLFSSLPMNKAYANLPDKISYTTVEKDQNGVVTSTDNSTVNQVITYNSYGFVATRYNVNTPNLKTTFLYNK